MIADTLNRIRGYFTYDGAESSNRRRSVSSRIKSTDKILTTTKRKQLIANTQDLQRNFAIAGWAIRRHLDYVSTFNFQPKTGDEAIDAELAGLMKWFNRPLNCDVAGRHSLMQMVRMAEEHRTTAGDILLVKTNRGMIQAIESDRLRDPDEMGIDDNWRHGIQISPAGRARRYSIHKRDGSGSYEFERIIQAKNALHFGYFDRFDQVRGVSPLAPAINAFRDVYEGIEYALAKSKVSQMLGLVMTSTYEEGLGNEGTETSGDDDTDYEDGDRYEVDLGPAPWKLELEPGDKAEILESKTPSAEFQQFMQTVIGAALKSLDIPYSFYDESFTNFFGSRAALLHYEKSCRGKRSAVRDLLDRITLWRFRKFIFDGVLELPNGMRAEDLRWEWVHEGTPWWDPAKEIRADLMAINGGLTTRSRVVKERLGTEWRDVVKELAQEEAYMAENGIPVVRGTNWQAIQEMPEEQE
jgi:capsid protein